MVGLLGVPITLQKEEQFLIPGGLLCLQNPLRRGDRCLPRFPTIPPMPGGPVPRGASCPGSYAHKRRYR